MKLIKYGVFGLSEWIILLNIAKRNIKVHFTGGVTSGSGVVPATYETKNPIIQLAIMQSNYFKEGRIQVVKSVDIDDEPFINKNEDNASGEVNDIPEVNSDNPDTVSNNTVEVTVGSMAEAIDYLQEHFPKEMEGVTITRKKDAVEKGASLGIVFKGL